MQPEDRVAEIERRIRKALNVESIWIEDESHLHEGHAGARDGRGHYRVSIVAEDFAGLSPIARHRTVYAAVGDLMQTDIHALSIEAHASEEF